MKKPRKKHVAWNISKSRRAKNRKKRRTSARRNLLKKIHVAPPEDFSLALNYREVNVFFVKVIGLIRQGYHIYIDQAGVKRITPETILYLLSIIRSATFKNTRFRVSGNAPGLPPYRDMFINSGFYEYFQTHVFSLATDEIYAIKIGSNVSTDVVSEIIAWTKGKCPPSLQNEPNTLKNIGKIENIIKEMMGNVREHAYKNNGFWYLMAFHDQEQGTINYSVIDTGQGIPTTIRKKLIEIIQEILPGIGTDCYLIKNSFSRDFIRSRTAKSNRGRGLPQMYAIATSGIIRELTVISGKGYFQLKNQGNATLYDVKENIEGTIVSWIYKL